MWTLTWKGLLAHKARLVLTGLAVVLGTGFVAGALTFGDTLEDGFEELFTSIVGSADAVVRAAEADPAASADADPGAGSPSQTLDPDLLDDIRSVAEVGLAEGEIEGSAVLIDDEGEPIGQFGPPTLSYNAFENEELDPSELREGRWPETEGEVAIDAGSAGSQQWQVGDEVAVVFDGPVETVEVVGIFGLGEMDNLAGASVVLLDPDTAADRLGTDGRYTSIYVSAAQGTSEDALLEALRSELPADTQVLTAAELADEQQAAVAPFIDIFSTILLVFAVIALLVGSFLIFNTFTIVLAGRMKELALLRAVGAGRGQLLRSVLGEAAAVGVVGGAVGVAFGLLVALALRSLLGGIGVEFPGEGLVVEPRTIVVAVLVGLVVTLVAAVIPARRAVRVPPVAALTEVAVAAPIGSGRIRTAFGFLLLVVGVAAMAATLVGDAGPASLGAGAVAVFLGVATLTALFARPLAAVIGWPAARTGISGELARGNAMRNPRRTAATASALMIGLALVAFVSILAASLQATIDGAIERTFTVDAFVQAATMGGVPDGVLDALGSLDEVEVAAPLRATQLEVGDETPFAAVLDADDLLAVLALEAVDGDPEDLREGGVIVVESVADDLGLGAGDEVTAELPDGAVDLPIAAVVDGAGLDASWFVEATTFEEGGGSADVVNVYLRFAEDVEPQAGVDAVEAALADYPQVTVFDQASLAAEVGEQLDQLVGVVVALLALSVLVALLGIVNTLVLSVVERTREIGLLRAIGMTRSQVRRMVRQEAVTVALIGAALGLAVGVPFGAAFVGVDDFNLDTFAVPWVQLVVGVVVAALAGLLAGVLPARRAARMDVLDALHAD